MTISNAGVPINEANNPNNPNHLITDLDGCKELCTKYTDCM